MDTVPLRDAYRAFLDAAAAVAGSAAPTPAAPDGGWNADQILGHSCWPAGTPWKNRPGQRRAGAISRALPSGCGASTATSPTPPRHWPGQPAE
jgi:hypothetical protein